MPVAAIYRKNPAKCIASSSLYQLRMREDPVWRAKRLEMSRSHRLRHPEMYREYHRRKYAHQKQASAYTAVRRALKSGKLVRPEMCSRCGRVPPPQINGRSNLHAHHEDYTKFLEVRWLCSTCHGRTWRKL